ncbi:MAG: putative peroxidase-related enzyme [Planctomycetota bacterium]
MDAIARDWRAAKLTDADRALCEYAEKLTVDPAAMSQIEVDALRAAGFSDPAIHDASQVVSYFNYINRIADALGVELEDFVRAWGE